MTHPPRRPSLPPRAPARRLPAPRRPAPRLPLWALALATVAGGCQPPDEPAFSFYEERIGPIVQNSCARQNTGCHLPRADGTALGNLDLSSYDSLIRREDVLDPYGPYATSLFLLKAGDPIEVQVQTFDPAEPFVRVRTDIRHNAGANVDLGSTGYAQIRQWIAAGHTRSGLPDETLAENLGPCVRGPGEDEHFDPAAEPADAESFRAFVSDVQPVLRDRCAGSTCHGNFALDPYLACGETEAERRWNYFVSVAFLAAPASTSGLLRRPLSTFRGGVFHEGGDVFASTEDPDYETIRAWAADLVEGAPDALALPFTPTVGQRYFADRVQPTLVRKGCAFLNCHSPAMFHDLRLRGGAGGVFSWRSTLHNYDISRELLAIDSPDPNRSRLIAKNLFAPEAIAGQPGIFHRGGPLLEDFGVTEAGEVNGATPDDCAGFDLDEGDLNEVPAYCVMVRWHQVEREAAIARGEIDPDPDVVRGVVWVARPTDVGDPRDFDTYRPGADLRLAEATLDPGSGDLSLGPERSLLAGCGLDAASADVRGPAVSWDGARIAFSARESADEPHRIYRMASDGSGCALDTSIAPAVDEANGILTHDLDPAFAADGRLVFASSRGNLDRRILGVDGPTRTPSELAPNANLYIQDADGAVRQLTFLLNQELMPALMTDGRLIFTTEKRQPDFFQLAGRRINLDGGDYHPLFAQRNSVGYERATEFVELYNRNLAFVAAPADAADGAGAIVIVNRSIGPDQANRDPNDRYYIASTRIPIPGAFGGGTGVYRSPAALPSGRLLVACDRGADDLTAGSYDFDLCELDPDTGALRELGGAAGLADIEAVPIVARAARSIFVSRPDEANGATRIEPGQIDAEVEILDFPLLATLLFENTREGRDLDPNVGGIDVYAARPPPTGVERFAELPSADVVEDRFGRVYAALDELGHVDLNPDGSTKFRYRGGLPILLGVTDHDGEPLLFGPDAPFAGPMIQREQMQFYPGERIRQSFPRTLFNGMCGGCHGSLTNRELHVAVDVDVLTMASRRQSQGQSARTLGDL
ncbi:MAG: TolB family protein [Sandaracinaceae bacterium]